MDIERRAERHLRTCNRAGYGRWKYKSRTEHSFVPSSVPRQHAVLVLLVECAPEQAASPRARNCRKISRRLYENPPKYAIVARSCVPCDSDNSMDAQGKFFCANCAIGCTTFAVATHHFQRHIQSSAPPDPVAHGPVTTIIREFSLRRRARHAEPEIRADGTARWTPTERRPDNMFAK